jgi:hypothetical protein
MLSRAAPRSSAWVRPGWRRWRHRWLATLASPLAGDARKTSRQSRKNIKNQVNANKLCRPQVAVCETFLAPACEENPNCAEIVACCSFFGTCNVTGFFDCLQELDQDQEETARLIR